ncbi:hypothetical protein NB706_003346 [Xanthomonas sacchari]|nr:hypothetical protein [Xanthomonas sacchari]
MAWLSGEAGVRSACFLLVPAVSSAAVSLTSFGCGGASAAGAAAKASSQCHSAVSQSGL